MKSTIIIALIGLVGAVKISDPAYTRESIQGEFDMRKEELKDLQVNRLTDKWQARIDNYDPDIDQELATDLLNNSKRHASIAALEKKVKGMSPWDGEYESQHQMLRTLKEEESSNQNKAAGHEMDIFDV